MRQRIAPLLIVLVVIGIVGLAACDRSSNPLAPTDSSLSATSGNAGAAGGPNQDPKLNLSHIECVDGTVEIHFVLLFVPDGVTPGTLSYDYGSIAPGANTGNVWHFTASGLPPGDYEVTFATVTLSDGTVVNLHNPGDYTGTYDCDEVSECLSAPEPEPLLCLDPSDLGSPVAECAYFGLPALGKDDDLSGSTHTASMDAALAIVKDGRGTCDAGLNAYRTYSNVQAGDLLEKPLDAGDISHVTYCDCAD